MGIKSIKFVTLDRADIHTKLGDFDRNAAPIDLNVTKYTIGYHCFYSYLFVLQCFSCSIFLKN